MIPENKKVNLFLIGAQKAGTTSLYEYLSKHPGICFADAKEVHFFSEERFYEQGLSYLSSFYPHYKDEPIIGCSYVHTLVQLDSLERIYAYNPEMKIIVMLRDPVKRAYSAYHFAIKNGWEKEGLGFLDTMKLEPKRLEGTRTERYELAYFYNGLYYQHLKPWIDAFGMGNILLIKDSDLKSDARAVLLDIEQFLGIEHSEIDTSKQHNRAGGSRWKWLNEFLRNNESPLKNIVGNALPHKYKRYINRKLIVPIRNWNMTEAEYKPLSPAETEKASEYFSKDLLELRNKLGVNFDDSLE